MVNAAVADPTSPIWSVESPRSEAELTSIELFAGGGGMALGMRQAGFRHAALVEWWKPAATVLRHNASPRTWATEDIREADVRTAINGLADFADISLVAGGPPCQPFSLAGASAGHSDERNMFPVAIELVRRLLPPYVVFENVPGLLRASFAPYFQYVQDQLRRPDVAPRSADEAWSEHHARLTESKGADLYRVYRQQINAADLGVAQTRKRVFLVAIRADVAGAAEWRGVELTHSRDELLRSQWVTGEYWQRHGLRTPDEVPHFLAAAVQRVARSEMDDSVKPWRTLRDLLSDIPEPEEGKVWEGWPNHIFIPGARAYRSHTGSPIDLPSKTIKAGVHGVAGGEAMIRFGDDSLRYLTVRESAMTQGFPRDYEFPTSRSRMMGVIGNAVAVDVAAAVGASLPGVAAIRSRAQDEAAPHALLA